MRRDHTEQHDQEQEATMSQPNDLEPEEPLQPQIEEAAAVDSAPQYEFNAHQNSILRGLAIKMKYVGFIYVFAGSLMIFVSALAFTAKNWFGLFCLCVFAPQLLIGIWNINAANSFGFVITTVGNDIRHLMNALVSLRKLYALLFWTTVLALSLVIVGIAGGIFGWVQITIK
jgi:hypothetical protein